MARAKISKIRGRTAIVIPDEVANKFNVLSGETVSVRETAQGLEISGMSPAADNDMRNAQATIQMYKDNWRYAGG